MRTGVVALAAAAALTVAAGCAAPAPRPAPAAVRAVDRGAAAARRARSAGRGRARAAAATCNPEAASLAPAGPPQVTPGSFMAKIRARGYLIAGVDQSTYHFGYLNPLDGQIEGFDIDMIKAVAEAIFGNPDKVEYKAISDAAADTRHPQRQRRHRRAHHDDHLRPAASRSISPASTSRRTSGCSS